MAYTEIPTTTYSATGATAPASVAADLVNGNFVDNSASLSLHIENAGVTDAEVTFISTATVSGYAVEDPSVTIPAGATIVFGRFPAAVFGTEVAFTSDVAINVAAYR